MAKLAWLHCVTVVGFLALLLPNSAHGQTPLDPSLEQAIANDKKTSGEAQKYTYTELKKDLTFDSKGRVKEDSSDTFEIIFLEGAPYQKHTLHNGKPLPEKNKSPKTRN